MQKWNSCGVTVAQQWQWWWQKNGVDRNIKDVCSAIAELFIPLHRVARNAEVCCSVMLLLVHCRKGTSLHVFNDPDFFTSLQLLLYHCQAADGVYGFIALLWQYQTVLLTDPRTHRRYKKNAFESDKTRQDANFKEILFFRLCFRFCVCC